jgi:hypothetical protein
MAVTNETLELARHVKFCSEMMINIPTNSEGNTFLFQLQMWQQCKSLKFYPTNLV